MPPQYVGGYEILGQLGRLGMAIFYKARHAKLGRIVSLKFLLADVASDGLPRERFLREARAMAALYPHPNIVQLHEVGECDWGLYLVLEFAEGGTLAEKLDGTPWPVPRAAELVEGVARAAHAVHGKGLVHRDIKPAKVLLTADGKPKLTGFDLVKRIGETENGAAIFGTPLYMPPEQITGRDHRTGPPSDVYALGGVLYELLTGRPPFPATNIMELLRRVIHDEPPPPGRLNPKLPRDLEVVCLKCLAKDPARRYHTAEALADDLRRFLDRQDGPTRG